MANVIELDGKEFELDLNLNALADVEEETGVSVTDLQGNMSMKVLRSLLYNGIKQTSPEVTETYIGKHITIQKLNEITPILNESLGGSKKLIRSRSMTWEDIKRIGYGLLNLKPKELFYEISVKDFNEMYEAHLFQRAWDDDSTNHRTAWQTSHILNGIKSSAGSKSKNIEVKDIYESRFDVGGRIQDVSKRETFTKIDEKYKQKQLKSLISKFDKGR